MFIKDRGRRKTITLFEYEKCPYDELANCDLDMILDGIESLNEASNKQLISLGHKYFSATQFVGMLQIGDVIIEVLPKIDYVIDKGFEDEGVKSAASNLLVMLAYAYNIKLDSQTLSSLTSITGNWYELLIRFFAMELHQQIRQGLFRNYQNKEDTLPYIKGRWDISTQIRKHAHVKTTFDLYFDEFTENILLNQLFSTVSKTLLINTQDKTSRRLLMDINRWLANVEDLFNVDQVMFNQIHFSRLNDRYEDAFSLAKLFFEGQSLQVKVGDTSAFAFVFDMNNLFERFITQFIIKHRKKIFRKFEYNPSIVPQMSNKKTYLAKDELGHGKINLRPDIVLKHPVSKTNMLILDTKYKQLNTEQSSNKLSPSDIYQMLAYSIRLSCDNVMLIFPQTQINEIINNRIIVSRDEKTTSIFVKTVNLHQPLDKEELLISDLCLLFQPVIGG
ncbi:MAG: McrC family protein [Candidatus Hodarchaeales archaeon]